MNMDELINIFRQEAQRRRTAPGRWQPRREKRAGKSVLLGEEYIRGAHGEIRKKDRAPYDGLSAKDRSRQQKRYKAELAEAIEKQATIKNGKSVNTEGGDDATDTG